MSMFDKNEWLAEMTFNTEMQRARIQREADSGIWITKNGIRIRVTDMADSHLINTYRILEENNIMDMLLPWLVVMQKEIIKRKLDYKFKDRFF